MQKIVTEESSYVEKFNTAGGNIFSKRSWGKRVAASDSRRNVCCIDTFHANGCSTEAQRENIFLTKSTCGHNKFQFCHFFGQTESLHFIDSTFKDTYEGPNNS